MRTIATVSLVALALAGAWTVTWLSAAGSPPLPPEPPAFWMAAPPDSSRGPWELLPVERQ